MVIVLSYSVYLRLLTTTLVYFSHCIVRTSSIYGFWLLLWYILSIVLAVLRLFTASDYSFCIFWSLYCLYFVYLLLLITSLVYFGHCIVRTSSIYGFGLLLWYILVIVLSVLRLFTAFDYFFGIFWSLYCPYFVYVRLLITSLVYFGDCIVRTSSIYGFWLLLWYILVIVLSVLRLFTLLITSLVYFGHCIVRTSSMYGFLLLHWYILVIILSVLCLFTASDYFFGIFWSLYCPYFVYLRLLITSLVYVGHCIIRTASIYGFWLLLWYILSILLVIHWPIYGLWLLIWYILVIVLFVLHLWYVLVIVLFVLHLWYLLVIVLSVLHLWYILVIALSIPLLFTTYDYYFGIF